MQKKINLQLAYLRKKKGITQQKPTRMQSMHIMKFKAQTKKAKSASNSNTTSTYETSLKTMKEKH